VARVRVSARTIRQSVSVLVDGAPDSREQARLMARIANANAETQDALVEIEKIASSIRRTYSH
jgi:hypothetical protein